MNDFSGRYHVDDNNAFPHRGDAAGPGLVSTRASAVSKQSNRHPPKLASATHKTATVPPCLDGAERTRPACRYWNDLDLLMVGYKQLKAWMKGQATAEYRSQ